MKVNSNIYRANESNKMYILFEAFNNNYYFSLYLTGQIVGQGNVTHPSKLSSYISLQATKISTRNTHGMRTTISCT